MTAAELGGAVGTGVDETGAGDGVLPGGAAVGVGVGVVGETLDGLVGVGEPGEAPATGGELVLDPVGDDDGPAAGAVADGEPPEGDAGATGLLLGTTEVGAERGPMDAPDEHAVKAATAITLPINRWNGRTTIYPGSVRQ